MLMSERLLYFRPGWYDARKTAKSLVRLPARSGLGLEIAHNRFIVQISRRRPKVKKTK